jgi:hypothetical protein
VCRNTIFGGGAGALLCTTSDWRSALAAVEDDGGQVLVDHGAAVRAPPEPRLDLIGLHDDGAGRGEGACLQEQGRGGFVSQHRQEGRRLAPRRHAVAEEPISGSPRRQNPLIPPTNSSSAIHPLISKSGGTCQDYEPPRCLLQENPGTNGRSTSRDVRPNRRSKLDEEEPVGERIVVG